MPSFLPFFNLFLPLVSVALVHEITFPSLSLSPSFVARTSRAAELPPLRQAEPNRDFMAEDSYVRMEDGVTSVSLTITILPVSPRVLTSESRL